jgi:undecaprenyl-diphosphatase
MPQLDYLIAAAIQGFLEWLPISSSGQVSIFLMRLTGVTPQIALQLSLYLHLGTALSAITFFRREIINSLYMLVKGSIDGLAKFVIASILTSLPTGYLIYRLVNTYFGEVTLDVATLTIGLALMATSGILIISGKRKRTIVNPNGRTLVLDGAFMGLLQGLAVIPGLSRSAITLGYLLIRGYSPTDSVKYSFISGIIASLASGIYIALTSQRIGYGVNMINILIVSYLAGLASVTLMATIAKKVKATAYFLVVLSAIIIIGTLVFSIL